MQGNELPHTLGKHATLQLVNVGANKNVLFFCCDTYHVDFVREQSSTLQQQDFSAAAACGIMQKKFFASNMPFGATRSGQEEEQTWQHLLPGHVLQL